MRQNAPWTVKGVDPALRDAARAAARKAGMSLGEWLNSVIAGMADDGEDVGHVSYADQHSDEELLEKVMARLSRSLVPLGVRGQLSQANLEDLIARAEKASRRSQESADKAAQALSHISGWIETAQQRLSRTNTAQVQDNQDQSSAGLEEALRLVARKVDDMERKMSQSRQSGSASPSDALERLERSLSKIMREDDSKLDSRKIDTALRNLDEKLALIGQRAAQDSRTSVSSRSLDEDYHPRASHVSRLRQGLESAMSELRERASQPHRGHDDIESSRGWGVDHRSPSTSFDALREDIHRLAAKIDETGRSDSVSRVSQSKASQDMQASLWTTLRTEIARLQESMGSVASTKEMRALEQAIQSLAEHITDLPDDRSLGKITHMVEQVGHDIKKLSETTSRQSQERTVNLLEALARKIDGLAAKHVDPKTLTDILRQLAEVRSSALDADSVSVLAQQIAELSRQIAHVGQRQVDAVEFTGLRSAVEDIRSNLKKGLSDDLTVQQLRDIAHHIDRLAGRIDRAVSEPQAELEKRLETLSADISAQIGTLVQTSPRDIDLRLDALMRKVDALAEREPSGPPRELEKLVRRIDAFVGQQMADSSEDFQNLSDKIDALSQRLSASSGAGAPTRELETLARKLDALLDRDTSRDLPEIDVIERKIDSFMDRLERGFMPQASEMQSLSQKVDDLLTRQLEPRRDLETLERKMDALLETATKPIVPTSAELDKLSNKLDLLLKSKPTAPEFESLERKVDTLLQRDPGALPDFDAIVRKLDGLTLASSPKNDLSDALSGVIARIEKLDAKLAKAPEKGEVGRIEEMLMQLADRIDQARRPDAGSETLDGLERHIADLAQRIEKLGSQTSSGPDLTHTIGSIERSISGLLREIEHLREETAVTAERAARAAVADTMAKLPSALNIKAPEVDDLKRDLASVKSRQDVAGRRMDETLEAVNDTLHRIVSRLGTLEKDHGSRPDPISVRHERVAAPSRTAPVMDDSHLDEKPSDETLPLELAARDIRLKSQPNFDFKTGFAKKEAGASDGSSPDLKASFIAAARRAAQAAAQETTQATQRARAGAAAFGPTSRNRGASVQGGAVPLDRLKQAYQRSRRPILLGLAGIVMALGAAQVIAGLQKGETSVPTAQLVPPQTAPAQFADAGRMAQPQAPAQSLVQQPVRDPAATASVPMQDPRQAMAPATQAAPVVSAPAAPMQQASLPPQAQPASSTVRITGLSTIGEIPSPPALEGLKRAALAGEPAAVHELAARFAEGRGVPRDVRLAARIFEKAAQQGMAPAQYRLGSIYEKGQGVSRDVQIAKGWYEKAAAQGNAKAMHNLAVLYAEGLNGRPDYPSAVEWFRKAADAGVRDSQYNLAILLARGLGAPQNLTQSYILFSLAAAKGDEDAGKKREEVGSRLNPQDLANAKAAVERWRPTTLDAAANEPGRWVEQSALTSKNGRGQG